LWHYFAALAVLALVLARIPHAEISFRTCFLVFVGLAPSVVPFLCIWLVLRAPLARKMPAIASNRNYNAVQMAWFLATMGVAIALFLSAQQVLRSNVSTMLVNQNPAGGLSWYVDRVENMTPQARLITLPTNLWSALWALWVIWLAWRCIGWSRQAWRVISQGGSLRFATPKPEMANSEDQSERSKQ
jgi:hypothetical protein